MHLSYLAIYIILIFLLAPTLSQGQTLPSPSSLTATPSPTLTQKTEVSGFLLQGKKFFEVLNIDDLETLVLRDGKRLIPLLRLLKALEIQVEEKRIPLPSAPRLL